MDSVERLKNKRIWSQPHGHYNPDELCQEAAKDMEIALTALRRIRSLEEKNVPKYAQQIAKEALDRLQRDSCNIS
jgi:hypothetical protein